MKKIALLFCLFVFCFCCTVSLAEEPAELIFLDIPWFSTPEEISDILVSAGFIPKSRPIGEKDVNTFGSLPEMKEKYGVACMPSNICKDPEDQECPYIYYVIGLKNPERYPQLTRKLATIFLTAGVKGTFANAKVSSLAFYFTSDDENHQLVECQIGCSKSSNQDEILAALEELYGKPAAEKRKQYIWFGANNTILCFDSYKSKIGYATIDGLNLAESYDIQVPE